MIMTPAEFVRQYYPKISDEMIEKNDLEIAYVMLSQKRCESCFCLDMCDTLMNTAGYTPVMELGANGQISTPMAACRYNKDGVRPKARQAAIAVGQNSVPVESAKPIVQNLLDFQGKRRRYEQD
jgi:hypothetical protein